MKCAEEKRKVTNKEDPGCPSCGKLHFHDIDAILVVNIIILANIYTKFILFPFYFSIIILN